MTALSAALNKRDPVAVPLLGSCGAAPSCGRDRRYRPDRPLGRAWTMLEDAYVQVDGKPHPRPPAPARSPWARFSFQPVGLGWWTGCCTQKSSFSPLPVDSSLSPSCEFPGADPATSQQLLFNDRLTSVSLPLEGVVWVAFSSWQVSATVHLVPLQP